ncbi:MAG: AcrR family transcriptional regulator [Halieaceae bacterium]|jgi:AcrR family transcriptional regulator
MTDTAGERAYHHGNLRAELIDQAAAQLRETPAEQLSLRAVARALGVSQTAPYRHFSDREALLAAIATRGYRQLLVALEEARANAGDSAAEQLRAVGRSYVEYAAGHEQLFKLMFGPHVQPSEKYPELREASREALLLVQAILQHGMGRSEFAAQDVVYLANAAWAGIHGVATLRIDAPALFKNHIDLTRQINVSANTFIAGIEQHPA